MTIQEAIRSEKPFGRKDTFWFRSEIDFQGIGLKYSDILADDWEILVCEEHGATWMQGESVERALCYTCRCGVKEKPAVMLEWAHGFGKIEGEKPEGLKAVEKATDLAREYRQLGKTDLAKNKAVEHMLSDWDQILDSCYPLAAGRMKDLAIEQEELLKACDEDCANTGCSCLPEDLYQKNNHLSDCKCSECTKKGPVCYHIWQTYLGLSEEFDFCTKCGAKKKKEFSLK